MANTKLSMCKIHEALRLSLVAKMSARAIARSRKTSPMIITDYLHRTQAAGLDWEAGEALDGPQRNQTGIARTGAHKVDLAG